jgi:hypothetical protein
MDTDSIAAIKRKCFDTNFTNFREAKPQNLSPVHRMGEGSAKHRLIFQRNLDHCEFEILRLGIAVWVRLK